MPGRDKAVIAFSVLVVIAIFFAGYYTGSAGKAAGGQALSLRPSDTDIKTLPSGYEGHAEVKVPAIDQAGKGVVSTIRVYARPGTGQALADINSVLFFVDTQNSIRIAKDVAENETKVSLSGTDLVYSIDTNASVIEGPSAGAALAVATAAALTNKTLRMDVMMTGTILPDGSIGVPGAIEEKARAAKNAGARLFLVPQAYLDGKYGFAKAKECRDFTAYRYCETDYLRKEMNLTQSWGIGVRGVANIGGALEYFIGEK